MKRWLLLRYVSKYNHIKTLSCVAFSLWGRCGSLVCDEEGLQKAGVQRAIPFGLLNIVMLTSSGFSI